jgi:hypothetical protein
MTTGRASRPQSRSALETGARCSRPPMSGSAEQYQDPAGPAHLVRQAFDGDAPDSHCGSRTRRGPRRQASSYSNRSGIVARLAKMSRILLPRSLYPTTSSLSSADRPTLTNRLHPRSGPGRRPSARRDPRTPSRPRRTRLRACGGYAQLCADPTRIPHLRTVWSHPYRAITRHLPRRATATAHCQTLSCSTTFAQHDGTKASDRRHALESCTPYS